MNIPIIDILVALILIALLFWGMGRLGIPEMIQNVVTVIVVVLFVIWIIQVLLGHGHGIIRFGEVKLFIAQDSSSCYSHNTQNRRTHHEA